MQGERRQYEKGRNREGMSLEEIAQVLGCTRQNVQQLEYRALQKLRRKRHLLDALVELAKMAEAHRRAQSAAEDMAPGGGVTL
jgi:transcriptional regulator